MIVPKAEHLVERLFHSCRGHMSLYDRKYSPCTSSPFPTLNEVTNTILTSSPKTVHTGQTPLSTSLVYDLVIVVMFPFI